MQSIYFFTLGCRLNQAESAVLQGVVRDKGFRVVSRLADADIVVINSCTVTEAGDAGARRVVSRVNRENPSARIAVIGCQAQIQKKELFSLKGVRWVIGTAEKMHLVDILSSVTKGKAVLVAPPIRRVPFTMPLTTIAGSRTRANLKIQDGCDQYCAYCEIPYARGRARSRVFSDVLREAQALVQAGHREIVLTGINVGLYANGGKTLFDVVAEMQKIAGLDRIRISSIEHTTLPLELIRFMMPHGKLCRFLHVPIQSGSDRILKRMGRVYSTASFSDMVRTMEERVPGLMIGTDVIVGFPGETEKDFETTRKLLEGLPLGYFHVFSYSPRRRARSRTFRGTVSNPEVARRSEVLRRLSEEKRGIFLRAQIGLVGEVLFEQKKNDYWIGHADNYATIKLRSEEDLRNCILDVRMVSVDGQSIIGSPDP